MLARFQDTIEADGRRVTFHFTLIATINGFKYFVSIVNNTVKAHFSMINLTNEWLILFTPDLPEWLKGFEGKLSDSISAHNANEAFKGNY